ncbi:MAG TPA: hypothetical protein ENJ62_06260, partial [Bryobacterales bacterium]|nr:hypothetical protein [Bryobacterales bacterium]
MGMKATSASLLAPVIAAGLLYGQTAIDLSRQARQVDFTAAAWTKPLQAGTTLPGFCEPGAMFFKTDAPAGENVYGCVAQDTWVLMTTGGDAKSLQGNALGAGGASALGQFYAWDPGTGKLELFSFGNLLAINGRAVNVATESVAQYGASAALPGSCSAYGIFYFDTDGRTGEKLYYCNGMNWEQVAGGAGPVSGDAALREDFPGGSNEDGEIGQLGWAAQAVGAAAGWAVAHADGGNAHPGVVRLSSGTAAGTGASIGLAADSSARLVSDLSSIASLTAIFIVRPGTTTGAVYRAGFVQAGESGSVDPAEYAAFEFDTRVSQTTWNYVMQPAGGTKVTVDSGVAVTAGSWYALRFRITTAGTYRFSVSADGGAWSAEKTICASG